MRRFILIVLLLFTCLFARLSANGIDTVAIRAEFDSAQILLDKDVMAAFEIFSRLYERVRYSNHTLLKMQISRAIGVSYARKADYEKSIKYYYRSIIYAKRIEDWSYISELYAYVEISHYLLGNIKESLVSNEKAQEYAERSGNLRIQAKVLLGRANTYTVIGKEEESYALYQECVEHCLTYKKCDCFVLCWLGALRTSKMLGEFNADLLDVEIDTVLLNRNNKQLSNFFYYITLAEYKIDLTRAEREAYYIKAISMYENTNVEWYLQEGYFFFGEYLLKEGDYEKAGKYVAKIQAQSKIYDNKKLEISHFFSKFYKEIGDYKKAYKYSNQYATLKNEFFEDQSKNIDEHFVTEYLAEKDVALEALDQKIEDKKSENLKQYFTYATNLFSLFLLIVFVLCYLFWHVSKRKNKHRSILALKKAKLKDSERIRTNFINSISHELRTPLYTIMGLIELIRTSKNKEEFDHYVDTLDFSKNYLFTFMDQLITLNSHDEDEFKTIRHELITIHKFIKNIVFSIEANGTENQFIIEVDPKLPKQIMGDSLKLSQVLFNLLNNANKFTHSGSIFIRLSLLDQSDTDLTIHFEIEDTGIGIDSDKQKLIFKAFFRGATTSGKVYDGAGVGLSVVKKLLEVQGSKINLRSKKGIGTAFFFDLKFRKVPKKKVITLKPTKDINIYGDIPQNIHILLVEDNRVSQIVIQKIIRKKGWECSIANNGREAVEMVANNRYSIILMDIIMPEMDGYEATKAIRKLNAAVPIVALTAVSSVENKEQFEEAGLDIIIKKPVDPSIFYTTILQNVPRVVPSKV